MGPSQKLPGSTPHSLTSAVFPALVQLFSSRDNRLSTVFVGDNHPGEHRGVVAMGAVRLTTTARRGILTVEGERIDGERVCFNITAGPGVAYSVDDTQILFIGPDVDIIFMFRPLS